LINADGYATIKNNTLLFKIVLYVIVFALFSI